MLSNVNLNHVVTSGIYIMQDNDGCESKPQNDLYNNILEVIRFELNSRITQRFYCVNSGGVYIRYGIVGESWGNWIKIG